MYEKIKNWLMKSNSPALEFGVGFAMGFVIMGIAILAIIIGAVL